MIDIAPANRVRTLSLVGGRKLGCFEWGPPDGAVVLFCSGSGMDGSFAFGAGDVNRLGIRLVSIDRPGFGASSPDPEKSFSSWVSDARELLGFLDVSTVSIVGFSQGAPFALALAAAGLGQCVAIVSGQDELHRFGAQLDPEVAHLVELVQSDPARFERELASRASPDFVARFVMGAGGPVDEAIHRQTAFRESFRRALSGGFRSGAAGYARDFVLALQPWPFDVEHIQASVDLWYGSEDRSTMHSPDKGTSLQRRLPNATLHLIDGSGGSVLWTAAAQILETLLERRP